MMWPPTSKPEQPPALQIASMGISTMIELANVKAQRDELLEALVICESNISSLLAANHPKVYGEWLSFVRTAIAKVTGAT